MKKRKNRKKGFLFRLWTMMALLWLLPVGIAAQSRGVSGVVVDEKGLPIIGGSVKVSGTVFGTATNLDGVYQVEVPEGKNQLEFSFLGYVTQIVTLGTGNILNVRLLPDDRILNEVVVIGYGTQKKNDLTGSVSVIGDKDFNKGLVSSPEQLINGKVAGVQIMSGGGSPTAASTIRIRGGASLNASNDPLIVLDGVPLESGGISGSGNFLSLINPNDIESMTILKDASSTAIYGSRASNGVLMITTKKGTDERLKINFTTTNSIQSPTKTADMLSEDQFRNVIETQGNSLQKSLLGNVSTNWNDEIFQSAWGTDNNLSLSGKMLKNLPFRVSLGAYEQEGILKTDIANRYTGSLSLGSSFLNDRLKFNVNLKGALNKNRFADGAAVWNAAAWNPTVPVYSETDLYGGYNEAVNNSGDLVTRAMLNPLGMLEERKSTSTVGRMIGNFDADYSPAFLPELRAHITLGYDYAQGEGKVYVPAEAAYNYASGGRDYKYGPQKNENRLFTAYLNYSKSFPEAKSTIDATLGYDYQFWKSTTAAFEELNTDRIAQSSSAPADQRHVLLSYYARLNYSYDSRYLLTATARRDGTSRFKEKWGTFPSLALAWRLSEEAFLKENPVLSNLKLRLSYGETGQQDGIGNYGYLPIYTYGQEGAQYRFGDQYYYTYRPEAYNSDLKWESTTAYNAGIDFGFLKGRISGSIDYYTRKTKDLLAVVPAPAGTNFNKTITSNVGNVNSEGWEFSLNLIPIDTKDWTWNVALNAAYQQVKIENLSLVKGAEIVNTPAGPTIDNTYFQVLTEGYAPYMFYVRKQLYDPASGKPVEGAYGDLYRYHSPAPDVMLGFSTQLQYKNWSLGMGFRANLGNYVYNGMAMNTGAFGTVSYNDFQLNNLNASYLKTGFQSRQYLSDYYVENASFLKMDNLTLGYDFGKIAKTFRLNASVMIQNVFTWTDYSGVDPEVPNGFDNSFYPRPRIFSLGLGLEF